MPLSIVLFIVLHWYLSAFSQTFFLHRYGAHKMLTMSKFWEKFFYFFTFLTQGSSFLNPRAYAVMHRMHHAYSDTPKDPHSPVYYSNPMSMMLNTFYVYRDLVAKKIQVPAEFEGNYPVWKGFDEFVDSLWVRSLFIAGYILFYVKFATAWWQYLFIPVHILMGPIHGAIVNWCGHRYGYQNHDNKDESKNSLPLDLVCLGELMQNNHHHAGMRPNFASKWFEIDPAYPIIRFFKAFKIVSF